MVKKPQPPGNPDADVLALVTAVARNEGMIVTPEYVLPADAAKRRGYLRERPGMRLFLTEHGRQWLELQNPAAAGAITMQKLTAQANLQLKDVARDSNTSMRDAIGAIIGAIYAERDRLTRYARAHGREHPWEAIPLLLDSVKAK